MATSCSRRAHTTGSLWLVLLLAYLGADTTHAASCDMASGADAIDACERELTREKGSIEVRLRYADVLMGQEEYQQAVDVLGEALRMAPGNDTVKRKYRLATSLAEEAKSMEHMSLQTPAAGTRRSVNEILCTTLKGKRALDACTKVLKADPRNVTALSRQGDELMAADRVEEAVASYRRAVVLAPADATLKGKLQSAQSKLAAAAPAQVAKIAPPTPQPPPPKKTVTTSQPEQQSPAQQPEQRQADIRPSVSAQTEARAHPPQTVVLAQKKSTEPARPIAPAHEPEPVEQFSNAPLSPGVTF